jgi:hypothetical protein
LGWPWDGVCEGVVTLVTYKYGIGKKKTLPVGQRDRTSFNSHDLGHHSENCRRKQGLPPLFCFGRDPPPAPTESRPPTASAGHRGGLGPGSPRRCRRCRCRFWPQRRRPNPSAAGAPHHARRGSWSRSGSAAARGPPPPPPPPTSSGAPFHVKAEESKKWIRLLVNPDSFLA